MVDESNFSPRIIYRIFGSQSPDDLWPIRDTQWKNKFLLLTTTDYPEQNIDRLKKEGFEVVPPKFTSLEAGENSAAFLNEGLSYLKERGEPYAFLMASGFQGSVSSIYPVFKNIFREYPPPKDIYFGVTPDIHGSSAADLKQVEGIYESRKSFFPSESLAVVKIDSVYPLNETLTKKGALGTDNEGRPLGGIELLLSIMQKTKEGNGLWTPEMCGVLLDVKRFAGKFLYQPDETSIGLNAIEFPKPVEYTLAKDKLARREATIDAALNKLDLTKEDYERLYDKTIIIDGFNHLTPNIDNLQK